MDRNDWQSPTLDYSSDLKLGRQKAKQRYNDVLVLEKQLHQLVVYFLRLVVGLQLDLPVLEPLLQLVVKLRLDLRVLLELQRDVLGLVAILEVELLGLLLLVLYWPDLHCWEVAELLHCREERHLNWWWAEVRPWQKAKNSNSIGSDKQIMVSVSLCCGSLSLKGYLLLSPPSLLLQVWYFHSGPPVYPCTQGF